MTRDEFIDCCYDKKTYSIIRKLPKGTLVIPVCIDIMDNKPDSAIVEPEIMLETDWLYDETFQISTQTADKRLLLLPELSEHPIVSDRYYIGFLVNISKI